MFMLESEPLVSSAQKTFTQRWGEDVVELSVPTITLNDLLDGQGVTSIDFLSMDIELSEPQALAGFDIHRFRPALVGIEVHLEVRQQILNYFAEHDYVIVGAYLWADTENLYFRGAARLDHIFQVLQRPDLDLRGRTLRRDVHQFARFEGVGDTLAGRACRNRLLLDLDEARKRERAGPASAEAPGDLCA